MREARLRRGSGPEAICNHFVLSYPSRREYNGEKMARKGAATVKDIPADQKRWGRILAWILAAGLCVGCSGKGNAGQTDTGTGSQSAQAEQPAGAAGSESNAIEWDRALEIDYTHDYSEEIRTDVGRVAADSASLQAELENMEKLVERYTPLAETAQTQGEMNVSSEWLFVIWDTELNDLWGRLRDCADEVAWKDLLAEQNNWIAMKEEVIAQRVGSREENGSMYPLLRNSVMEEITRNRSYVLADQLAAIKGEAFVLPEKSAKYGFFADNQGTGSVYSSLSTQLRFDGEEEARVCIYRQGETEGPFVDNGNGELAYTSYDGTVKGIIRINGWDGAGFEVTEASEQSPFSAGEEFSFPFAF